MYDIWNSPQLQITEIPYKTSFPIDGYTDTNRWVEHTGKV